MKTLEEVDEKVTSLETTLERFITYHDLFLRRLERDIEENNKLIEENGKLVEGNSKQIGECVRITEENSKQINESNKLISRLAEENSKQINESNERISRLAEENSKQINESNKLISRLAEENSKQINESNERINRLAEENSKQIDENNGRINRFIEENNKQIKENNKQWGALAKKMGTIDEDLVAPATRPVMQKYFNCEPTFRGIRLLKHSGSESFEVDVLVVCETQVFMIEVKSTPRPEHVEEILAKVKNFRRFFPEYEDKQVVPIFAGIVFSDEIVKYATKKDLYVMAYREWEYMDIINFNEIERK